uniref:Histamine receptor H4 n=1 Tax=Latimeria chalumnae TaxID=7897 RepID=H3AYA6_LATCH
LISQGQQRVSGLTCCRKPPDSSQSEGGDRLSENNTGGYPPHTHAVLSFLMILLTIITIVGNGLVILAFVVDKNLRNQSNYFFLNLAVSDFFVGAFCMPVYIPSALNNRWTLGENLCFAWLLLDYLLCTASVFNIVLISYDRFLSVTKAVSHRAQQGMTTHAVGKILAVWILAFLLYGPAVIYWKSETDYTCCTAKFIENWTFLLFASTVEFFVPFISVIYFNLRIYLSIRRRNRNRSIGRLPSRDGEGQFPSFFLKSCRASHSDIGSSSFSNPEENGGSVRSKTLLFKNKSKTGILDWVNVYPKAPERRYDTLSKNIAQRSRLSRDKKIAKSLAVLVCIFGICWAPYSLLMIIHAAVHLEHFDQYFEIPFWLLWVNSSINPFLYPLCHLSFRRAFMKIL